MSSLVYQELRRYQKRKLIYSISGREIICSQTVGENTRDEKKLLMYRRKDKYYIAFNGKPIASAETRSDCAKDAFVAGYLNEEQLHFFSKGWEAANDYIRRKRNLERLMR